MVLKGVYWVHNDKIWSNGLERSNLCTQCKNQIKWSWKESIGYTIQKSGHMVLKGLIWFEMSNLGTQNKHQVKWSWKESIVYTITKLGWMVLKAVNCVHNNKHQVKLSWKQSIGYTMIKLGHMVLKGVNCVHNNKIRSNGLERSQLGTQW